MKCKVHGEHCAVYTAPVFGRLPVQHILPENNSISRVREYGVVSMLVSQNQSRQNQLAYLKIWFMLTFQNLDPTAHCDHTFSDRNHCRVIVPKYHGDLSTAYNYTCLLVAFRDAVAGIYLSCRLFSSYRTLIGVCRSP